MNKSITSRFAVSIPVKPYVNINFADRQRKQNNLPYFSKNPFSKFNHFILNNFKVENDRIFNIHQKIPLLNWDFGSTLNITQL